VGTGFRSVDDEMSPKYQFHSLMSNRERSETERQGILSDNRIINNASTGGLYTFLCSLWVSFQTGAGRMSVAE
jgi:hypothetical protein